MTENRYLLGDADPELQRLATQHRIWSEVTCASWRRGGIGAGSRVLDLGAGPGFTSVELGQWVGPAGRVVAFDQSPRFVASLRQRAAQHGLENVTVQQGDIADLDLDEQFDVVYARWVFCFLPDPAAAVQRIARLLASGGRLITLDYFNYRAFCMAPRIPVMADLVAAIESSWQASGGSLEVQGDMGRYMAEAGLEVKLTRQSSRVARPGEPLWEWPRDFLRSFLPRLVESGAAEAATVEEFWDGWAERSRCAGSYLCLPPLMEIHGRKP